MFGRFFRWWFTTLAQMLPSGLRAGRERARAALLVDETPDGVKLRLRQRGRVRELGVLDSSAHNLPASVRRRVARVVVRPLAASVLVREVRLPIAAAEAPGDALELNMDTYTPFRADDVNFGFTVLPRRGTADSLAVQLAVVPRQRMERILAPLSALNLEPTRELDVANGDASVGLVYEPEHATRAAGTFVTGTLVALNLALATVLAVVPWQRQTAELELLETRVATAREQAEVVSVVEREIEAQQGRVAFLTSEMQRRPSMAVLLDELTRLLPDDSWLLGMQVTENSVRLQGFSARASSLISALQDTPLLARANFRSPIISDPATGAERFDIQAELIRPDADDKRAMHTVADKRGVE